MSKKQNAPALDGRQEEDRKQRQERKHVVRMRVMKATSSENHFWFTSQ